MDLRQLRYFVSVAEARSFFGASKRLHISQSALSRRIHDLEQDLGGERLFYRHARGVILTEVGDTFLVHARGILTAVEAARAACATAHHEHEKLSVGSTITPAATLVPQVLKFCKAAEPPVDMRIVQGSSHELHGFLTKGQLDAILCYQFPSREGLGITPLYREDCYLIGNRDLLGETSEDIRFNELGTIPLVLDPWTHTTRRKTETAAVQHNLRLDTRAELEPSGAKVQMIRSEGWATIAPYSFFVANNLAGFAVARRIVEPRITLTLKLAQPQSMAAAKQSAVREICRTVVDDIIEQGTLRWYRADGAT